jgi:hypothetical protein
MQFIDEKRFFYFRGAARILNKMAWHKTCSHLESSNGDESHA